jgi:hypothetical protein
MNRLLLIALFFIVFTAAAQPADCNFSKYLLAPNTPQLAKDIYQGRKWNTDAQGNILGVLDSLKAKDKLSRPFYFKVVTKAYSWADGAFAEGLGAVGKAYVEHNTKEFVAYFDNPSCFTSSDLETWAEIVVLELGLMADNRSGRGFFTEYINTLNQNCKDCSAGQKATLNTFIGLLQYNWKDYLIHSQSAEDSVLNCYYNNLALKYDFKVAVKRVEFSYTVALSVIDKATKKTIQVIKLATDVFHNCGDVRSFITGQNEKLEAKNNDYGDLIIGDFNFDGREDIAIKREAPGPNGPPYYFYIQDKNGRFIPDAFLTETMIYFPYDIDKNGRTLTTSTNAGPQGQCNTIYKYDALKNKWTMAGRAFFKE